MAGEPNPLPLRFKPGIQRDGTRLSAPGNWIDGQWTRFVRGMPTKMHGYAQISDSASGIMRSFNGFFKNGYHYLHAGSDQGMYQMLLTDAGGAASSFQSRTPSAYTMQGDELWQFDIMFDSVTGYSNIIAHPGRNQSDISQGNDTNIYTGDVTSSALLTSPGGLTAVSGGICVVHPYLTIFGDDGYFGWTAPNKLNDMTTVNGGGEGRITKQKIIAGRAVRGGNGPSGLYWSMNALIRTSYIGGTAVWAFDTISDRISVMSSRSMEEMDGTFYWMGLNRFFMYNGSVQELPNATNLHWLMGHLRPENRQKVFAMANVRWGEIWWCFPYDDATECTHAVIYNIRENSWYDTVLPEGGRGGAWSPDIFRWPVMSGVEAVSGSTYRVWQHETGINKVQGSDVSAIRSYIESSDISLVTGNQGKNKNITLLGIEPDFDQVGNMTLTITGNANARSEAKDAESITFAEPPVPEAEQVLRPKVERRQMRFRWESNEVDGDYQMGVPIGHVGEGGGRVTG